MANIRLGLIIGSAAKLRFAVNPEWEIRGARNPVVALQAE